MFARTTGLKGAASTWRSGRPGKGVARSRRPRRHSRGRGRLGFEEPTLGEAAKGGIASRLRSGIGCACGAPEQNRELGCAAKREVVARPGVHMREGEKGFCPGLHLQLLRRYICVVGEAQDLVLRRRACVQILFGYLGYFWKFGLGPGASRRKLQGLHRNGRAGRDDMQRRPAVKPLAKLIVAEFRKKRKVHSVGVIVVIHGSEETLTPKREPRRCGVGGSTAR